MSYSFKLSKWTCQWLELVQWMLGPWEIKISYCSYVTLECELTLIGKDASLDVLHIILRIWFFKMLSCAFVSILISYCIFQCMISDKSSCHLFCSFQERLKWAKFGICRLNEENFHMNTKQKKKVSTKLTFLASY